MNIIVRPMLTKNGNCWQVRLDQHAVSFRSEREARAFVDTLQARLLAPHRLPHAEYRAAS